MTFYTTDLIEIQVENSSICNAACPQCIREMVFKDKSLMMETYLELDFFNRIPDYVYKQTKIFYFCGNLGDPCAAPNFLEVCKFVRQKNPNVIIKISTNGGLRSPAFWKELAEILGDKSEVMFAIDGLEETNHIYRVNVQWHKIMENAAAFIEGGGKPFWQYISFKHNQHQVEQARALAIKMGFAKFIVKPSHRFLLDEILGIESRGAGGVKLEPAEEKNLVHKVVWYKDSQKIKDLLNNSETSTINCFAKENKSLYIDYRGYILPCCYLAAHEYVSTLKNVDDGWNRAWNTYGNDNCSLRLHSWEDIINGPFFNNVENSWTKTYAEGRLSSCALTCSDAKNRVNDPVENDKFIRGSNWLNNNN